MKNRKATGRNIEKRLIFQRKLAQLKANPDIQILKNYPQHRCCDTFRHSCNVAVCACSLAIALHCRVDMEQLVTGAMLHDYYLYDIAQSGLTAYQHGIRHPRIALEHAQQKFNLTEKEKNIILSHMWPLPFSAMPRSREAVLVGLADKICAIREICFGMTAWR